MKKMFLGLIFVILLAVIGGVYYVVTNLDSIVKDAIETHGSAATQTAVRVDKVHIELADGAGTINGLTVANPKGFALSHAFSLGEIGLGIDIKSLREQPYVINNITVRAPKVFMEMNEDKQTNLNELKNNLGVGGGDAGKAVAKKAPNADKAAEPKLIIRQLVFADGSIHARVVPLKNKEYTLKLPSLNMTNLGGKNGATPTDLAKEIMDRLIEAAKKAIKEKGIDAELDKLKGKARARVEAEKARLKDKGDARLEEEKKKIEDKLKGLFGK